MIFKCTEGAGVGDYSPRPLSSFDTHARWQPVTQSARSRRSYGKIEDCEQSTPGLTQPIAIGTLNNENVDVQDVKNGNRKWIFSVFQCSDSSNSTAEGKRIRCVRQKRSIKRNIELPVAIHEVRDGQHSGHLSSLLRLTRKRSVSSGKDKERLY